MIRELWLRIGGPNAIRISVWVAMAPISVLGFFLGFLRDMPEGAELSLLTISIVAYLPHGLILGIAWLTFLSPNSDRPSRPKLAIVTFLAAGFSTGVLFAILLESAGLEDNPDYWGLATTRALISLYWSTLLALVVDSLERFTSNAKELTSAIHMAIEVSKSRVRAVDALRVQLVDKVKETIEYALNVKSRLELHSAADQIVRPLVDSLRAKGISVATQLPPETKRISVRPIVVSTLASPTAPMFASAVAAFGNLVASGRWLSPATLLNIALVGAVMAITLWLIRKVRPGVLLLSLLYCIGIVISVGSGAFFQPFAPEQARELGNLNLGSWLIAIFVGSFLQFEARSRETIDQLKTTLEEIQWNKNRLEQELWVERLRLTRYVHGNIQSKIRAAAAKSGDLTAQQLEKLKEECLGMLDDEVSPVSFGEFVDQTKRVWLGILEFELELEPGLEKVLDEDSFARVAVIETVREGVLNAVRHGHAKNACLTIALNSNPRGQTLKLRLENDGDPIDPNSDSGFGSTVLNDSTASWQLENFPGGVVLKAEVPVSAGEVTSSAQ